MKCLGFIIVSVLSINTIFAQNFLSPTLGVLDFEPRGIPTYVSQQFTQILREEIESEELGIVIDRSTLLGTLEDRGYERSNCITDYCEAVIGRLLNANFIISGSVAYIDSSYIINTNMVSVRTGKLEHTETIIYDGNIDGLMDLPERLSYGVFNFTSPQELAEIEERKRMDVIAASSDEIIPVEITKPFMFPTTLRSTLLPGWGQFYSDNRNLGWSFLGTEAFLATTSFYFYKSYQYKKDDIDLYNRMYAETKDANKIKEFRAKVLQAEKEHIHYIDNFKYSLFMFGAVWALNIAHALIVDLDNNVSNGPDIDIVYNESTSQPQLRFSIELD